LSNLPPDILIQNNYLVVPGCDLLFGTTEAGLEEALRYGNLTDEVESFVKAQEALRPPSYTAVQRDPISLDEWEFEGAWSRGLKQREDALDWGYREKKQGDEDGGRLNALGQVVERAVAKRLNLYWRGTSGEDPHGPDLEPNIQVRLIGVEHYGLRVLPTDPDDRIIIGCVIPRGDWLHGCAAPSWWVPGGIRAVDGRANPAWKMNPNNMRPMHAVPQPKLLTVDECLVIARASTGG
jgi:hypothetical protein